MNKTPRDSNEQKTTRDFDKIAEGYVLNETSGLYEPKADTSAYRCKGEPTTANCKSPMEIDVLHDWLSIAISTLTLLLLALTVHYTRQQWREANRSADAADRSATAAQQTLTEAQAQTKIQRQEVEGELAATIIVDSPRPTPFSVEEKTLKRQGLYIYFANAGKVPASKIRARATLSRLGIPRFDNLSKIQIATAARELLAP